MEQRQVDSTSALMKILNKDKMSIKLQGIRLKRCCLMHINIYNSNQEEILTLFSRSKTRQRACLSFPL